MALLAQRLDELRLGRERPVADEAQDRLLPDDVAHPSTRPSTLERLVDLGLGDDERRQEAEHVRSCGEDEEPELAASSTTSPASRSSTRREQETRGRAPRGRRRARRARPRAAHRAPRRSREARSSIASTTAQAAAHATGLPPNVEPWSPGPIASATPVADEQRADRQPVPEPLRERHEVGLDAELLVGEERPGAAEPRLDLVEDEERADLPCDLGGGADERRRRAGGRRPRRGRARA